MTVKILQISTSYSQLIPLTIGIIRFKRLSFIQAKAFLVYMCISVGVESIAHYLAYYLQNNIFVYNIADGCLSVYVAFLLWDASDVRKRALALLFLTSIGISFYLRGITNYNPYAYLILYATVVTVSLTQLRIIIKDSLPNKQQMWFYMAFLSNGVMCINLYYIYSYLMKIRSQALLPYYISFNFASSIIFSILLSISFLCPNPRSKF